MSGRWVGREADWEWVVYDVMRSKALQKRDEMAGAGAEAEGGQESEAEGVPLTISKAAMEAGPLIFGSTVANGINTQNNAALALKSLLIHAITWLKKERGQIQKFITGANSAGKKAMDLYEGMLSCCNTFSIKGDWLALQN